MPHRQDIKLKKTLISNAPQTRYQTKEDTDIKCPTDKIVLWKKMRLRQDSFVERVCRRPNFLGKKILLIESCGVFYHVDVLSRYDINHYSQFTVKIYLQYMQYITHYSQITGQDLLPSYPTVYQWLFTKHSMQYIKGPIHWNTPQHTATHCNIL